MNKKEQNQINKKNGFSMIFEDVVIGGDQVMLSASPNSISKDWESIPQEGKLAIDILQNDNNIIVLSTIAGAVTDKIEVYVHNDLLTIRGERRTPFENNDEIEYTHQECFWGKFSRTIVLPTEVRGDLAYAEYKNGILRINIPKRKTDAKISVVVVEE